jgi:hypothetical protein
MDRTVKTNSRKRSLQENATKMKDPLRKEFSRKRRSRYFSRTFILVKIKEIYRHIKNI